MHMLRRHIQYFWRVCTSTAFTINFAEDSPFAKTTGTATGYFLLLGDMVLWIGLNKGITCTLLMVSTVDICGENFVSVLVLLFPVDNFNKPFNADFSASSK
eukprot:390862_1